MTEGNHLRRLSLIDLLARVVSYSDQDALTEFHDRRSVFVFSDRGRLLLAEYVDCLRCNEAERGKGQMAEHAYNLTITKFSRLPPPGEAPGSGTDCRNYFRPFVERHRDSMSSVLQGEYTAGQHLQRLVARQFHLSLLESLRHDCPGMSRYEWKLPTGTISVLMPLSVAGRRRRNWLEANIPDAEGSRPGESQRVQDIVNRCFGAQVEGLEDNVEYGEAAQAQSQQVSTMSGLPVAENVIEALATEKAERKAELSPGLRRLPESALKQLIHDICDTLMSDGAGKKSPRPAWMGKVEFSRFAGTRWTVRRSVPILWANLAHLLASQEDFVDAAKSAGVWAKVDDIVTRAPTRRRRRTSS